tara:strand:+ start:136 stop:834 length:699 start_codon:yes stop_codon:yes gene_type:complete
MSNKPLVSIIMSTYNAENTLAKSLDSIINQTYENIEILIMDDCSDDLSYQILKDYESNFSNVHIYKNSINLGLTKSLNILINKSNGDLIARQDSDDTSTRQRIEKQVKVIKDENLDFCTTRAIRDNSNKKIPGLSFNLPTKLVMKFKNPFIHGSLMVKKLLILKNGLYDENFYYAQDYKLFYDLLKVKAKFKVINEPLYHLSMENNISTRNKEVQQYYANCVKKNQIPELRK